MNQAHLLLRVSVARIAQALGVDNDLQITGNSYAELCDKVRSLEAGWINLAGLCADKANEQGSHVGTLTGLVTDDLTYRKVSISAEQVEELVEAASAVTAYLDEQIPGRERLRLALNAIVGRKS